MNLFHHLSFSYKIRFLFTFQSGVLHSARQKNLTILSQTRLTDLTTVIMRATSVFWGLSLKKIPDITVFWSLSSMKKRYNTVLGSSSMNEIYGIKESIFNKWDVAVSWGSSSVRENILCSEFCVQWMRYCVVLRFILIEWVKGIQLYSEVHL